jgi:hypothetical protein
MSTETLEQPHEVATAPVANEPDSPAPAEGMPGESIDRSIEDLIDEFDRVTAQPEPEPAPTIDNGQAQDGQDPIEELLREFADPGAKDRQRIDELTGEIGSLRAAEFQRAEREAAEAWAADLQSHVSRMNPNIPDDFVRDRLLVMAAENPALEQAWRFRNVSDAELATAKRDFQAAAQLYQQALKAPDTDPRKPEALRFLEQRGQHLQLMLGARGVIRSARNAILKRADEVKPPYDPAATEDRELVAQSIRDAGSGRAVPAEPPPNLGKMSDSEFRKYTLENFGF